LVRDVTCSVKRVGSDVHAGADRGEWQVKDAQALLGWVRGDRLYAAFLLSMLGLRRGEVCGLRCEHVDLTGDQAEARKLAKGMPSVAVENNRVSTLDGDGHTLVIEHESEGKGRAVALYLPAPQPLVDALRARKTQQAKERLAADRPRRARGAAPGAALRGRGPCSWGETRASDTYEAARESGVGRCFRLRRILLCPGC
jgi:integrase